MRILITGGAGFIGSNLAEKLSEDPNNSVTIVDNLLTGSVKNIPQKSNITFIKADVNNYNDIAGVFMGEAFDYVYHYAAVVGVQRTLEHPILVLEDISGIKNVLTLCKNTGVKRVLYASSSEVYGEPVEVPLHEVTSPLNARLPYAVVKNIGECYVRSFNQEHGLEFTIFRFFNTYGPRQSTDFVMSKFLHAALNNADITVYGDGSQSRTFGFVADNIDTTIACMTADAAKNRAVNIGSADPISIKELAEVIIKSTKSKSKVVHLPPLKEGDMTRRQPDNTLMKEILGRPPTPLADGLAKLVAYKQK